MKNHNYFFTCIFTLLIILSLVACSANEETPTPTQVESTISLAPSSMADSSSVVSSTVSSTISSQNLWKTAANNFYYGAGVGGWGTEIYVTTNGSFTGITYGQHWDITGTNHPNGMRFRREFSGKFSTPKKVKEKVYSVKVEQLSYPKKERESYYENGVLVHIGGEISELEKGETFYLYFPGANIQNMPEDFCVWAQLPAGTKTVPKGTYILVDATKETIFASF